MSLGLQQDECEGAEVLSLPPCLLLSPASVRHYGALSPCGSQHRTLRENMGQWSSIDGVWINKSLYFIPIRKKKDDILIGFWIPKTHMHRRLWKVSALLQDSRWRTDSGTAWDNSWCWLLLSHLMRWYATLTNDNIIINLLSAQLTHKQMRGFCKFYRHCKFMFSPFYSWPGATDHWE